VTFFFHPAFACLQSRSNTVSLSLRLFGAYQKETELFECKIGGSDQTVGTFVVRGSTLLARGTLLNLSVGIGLTNDADDFSITMSLPIRFGKPLN